MCNHPALSYPYSDNPIDGQLVAQCGKLLVLDRMLVKLHAAGALHPPSAILNSAIHKPEDHDVLLLVVQCTMRLSPCSCKPTLSHLYFTNQSMCATVCGLYLPA